MGSQFVRAKDYWLSCHLVTSSKQLRHISPAAAMQGSNSDCIIGNISVGVLGPNLGHSPHYVIQIELRTDCNSTAISPLGKLLWGKEKLKKLARSQVPDSDCDYDEVSSCYHCWLCQISEISSLHPMLPARQLYKQRGTGANISITPTDEPVGSCLFKYLAERLLCWHVLFCSSLHFEISGAGLRLASVAWSSERLECWGVRGKKKIVKPVSGCGF